MLLSWLLSAGMAFVASRPADTVYAFVDVTVMPMDRERVLPGYTVVIEGGRIVALGRAKETVIPDDAVRIDGQGKYLLPGLGDMHAHNGQGPDAMFLYVANGVTALRDLGVFETDGLRRTRAAGQDDGLLMPDFHATLRNCDEGLPRDLPVAQITACFTRGKTEGFESFKVYNDARETVDKMVLASKASGLPLSGHAPSRPGEGGLAKAFAIPFRSVEHPWGFLEAVLGVSDVWSLEQMPRLPFDPDTAVWMAPDFQLDSAALRRVAADARASGTWTVPTLKATEEFADALERGEMAMFPPGGWVVRTFRQAVWLHRQIVATLYRGGAGVLAGSDYGAPGFSLHGELQALVEAGLTPYQALTTATRNVARFLGREQDGGTIGLGKTADLLLLSANPLENIRATTHIAGVMRAGRWLPREVLEAKIAAMGRFQKTDLRNALHQAWDMPLIR